MKNLLRFFILMMCFALTDKMFAQRWSTVGKASYYHNRFHGRRMANGRIFSQDSMTCAHLHFPLGTWLRVKNNKTGKEVYVEVTDRGPYSKRFIIDLSMRAAKEVGIFYDHDQTVTLTPVSDQFIPFRLQQIAREKYIDNHDLQPFGEAHDYDWDADSLFNSAMDELATKFPIKKPKVKIK